MLWSLRYLQPSRRQAASLAQLCILRSASHGRHVVQEEVGESERLVGSYTPVTKKLWMERYKWDETTLEGAAPQTVVVPKPPNKTTVNYPFSTDLYLREHYRNPRGTARIGNILEDLDSFAGYIAYDHCNDGDAATRPPLLVTAAVEAIHLRNSHLGLNEDMQLSGRVVWTGKSALDVFMEILQGGQRQVAALFTFVSRDAVTLKAHPINPLVPSTPEDQRIFDARQRVADDRKALRAAGDKAGLLQGSAEQRALAVQLLQEARTKMDLPTLADPNAILMPQTSLSNTFTCQPQQRNMHGRVFGGFLMRCAFELAHSSAYLFAGSRPVAEEVGEISFRKPVEVGDLIHFKASILHACQSEEDPAKGRAVVQVVASVTQPEKVLSYVTNTFSFEFSFELARDAQGQPVPPKKVLPTTEEAALEVAKVCLPGATNNGFLELL